MVVEAFRLEVFSLAGLLSTREAANLIFRSEGRTVGPYHQELDALGVRQKRVAQDIAIMSTLTQLSIRAPFKEGCLSGPS